MLYNSNDTTSILSHIPFVYYHCDCPDLKTVNHEHTSTNNDDMNLDDTSIVTNDDTSSNLVLSSPPSEISSPSESLPFEDTTNYNMGHQLLSHDTCRSLYPLSRLYFCEDCHEIRCPHCVQDEIISYYCPNCLFEVPTASVKGEKNRCARNCFQCPVCQNTLGVSASNDTSNVTTTTTTTTNANANANTTSSSSSSHATAGPYFLKCHVCRWNSQEIGMLFEKPTGLALQLLKNEDDLPDTQAFDQLKTHFEKHMRINTPPFPSSFLSFSRPIRNVRRVCAPISPLTLHNTMFYNEQQQQQQQQQQQRQQQQQTRGLLDDITAYTHHTKVPDTESVTLQSLIGLQQVDEISTLTQRRTQLYDQPYQINQLHPQRTHLCIKRSKRCRTCRHILIKPEPKAQTTRFKIKLVAMNYIPTITIKSLNAQPSLDLTLGLSTRFALTFTNPLYEELTVSLATPPSQPGQITILSPHFSVGAYNETVEYDDEMEPIIDTMTLEQPRSGWTHDIYEKKSNHTSILIEVIPQTLGEFKFPLWVTCRYKPDEDRMDMSLGEIDQEDMDHSMEGKGSSLLRMDDADKIKRYSFWCLIGLGNVTLGSPL